MIVKKLRKETEREWGERKREIDRSIQRLRKGARERASV